MQPKLNDDIILELYVVQKLSSIEIAKIFNVHVSSVCRRLQKYNVIRPATGHEGRNGKNGTVYIHGYPMLYLPNHKRAKKNGYVFEHIVVAEAMLGRSLTDSEVVHHIDEDKTNNNPDNLMIFTNNQEHVRFHW